MEYVRALPVYARNLGVLLAPLIAAALSLALDYLGTWLFAPIGGALMFIVAIAIQIIFGYAFAVSLIFADDAWRHGHASLRAAWDTAARKPGEIVMAVIGFLFLMWVAQYIGGAIGGVIPYANYIVLAIALWAFIYTIPATALGGTPAGAALSASVRIARANPASTAILTVVCFVVYFGLSVFGFNAIGGFFHNPAAYDLTKLLLQAIAIGYIALVLAKVYASAAFRPYW